MEEKIRLAVFGQKRLSREGGIEIVVKELCTRMAQNGSRKRRACMAVDRKQQMQLFKEMVRDCV